MILVFQFAWSDGSILTSIDEYSAAFTGRFRWPLCVFHQICASVIVDKVAVTIQLKAVAARGSR